MINQKQGSGAMRISERSIDLDDIISDLHDSNASTLQPADRSINSSNQTTQQIGQDKKSPKAAKTNAVSNKMLQQRAQAQYNKYSSGLNVQGQKAGVGRQNANATVTGKKQAADKEHANPGGDTRNDESNTDRTNNTTTTGKKTTNTKASSRYADSGETMTDKPYNQATEERNNPIMDMESEITQSQQSLVRKNQDAFMYLNQQSPAHLTPSVSEQSYRYGALNENHENSVSGGALHQSTIQGLTSIESQQQDADLFQKKLDQLLINFRSETMQEFLGTKKQLGVEQAQAIEAERRRCNTMLGLKQSELENLRENLAAQTKRADEYTVRCEFLSFWSYQGKTLARVRTVMFRCFMQLKKYKEFKKHSKQMIAHKLARHKKERARAVFQAWQKHYKVWKVEKDKQDFQRAVKNEIQSISANYSKEIEMLRARLEDANLQIAQGNATKAGMQENLKKAFMRSVCALNFEAMNILDPNASSTDLSSQQNNQISLLEQEMTRQLAAAAQSQPSGQQTPSIQSTSGLGRLQNSNIVTPASETEAGPITQRSQVPNSGTISQGTGLSAINQRNPYTESRYSNVDSVGGLTYSASAVSEASEARRAEFADINQVENKINQFGRFNNEVKIESKEHLWKPAPIMGRDFTAREVSEPQVSRPTTSQITAQLRDPMQNNFVLPSHFNNPDQNQIRQFEATNDSAWPMNMNEYRQTHQQLYQDVQRMQAPEQAIQEQSPSLVSQPQFHPPSQVPAASLPDLMHLNQSQHLTESVNSSLSQHLPGEIHQPGLPTVIHNQAAAQEGKVVYANPNMMNGTQAPLRMTAASNQLRTTQASNK